MSILATVPRNEKEARFAELSELVTRAQRDQVKANRPDPRAWAFGFAGRPRAFLRQIIGEEWDGPDWQSWRAFISAVFGEKLQTAGEWWAFRRCTQLEEPPQQRPPSVWLPVGRRGGKSRMLAAIAVYLATAFDWTHYLAAGETGVLPILAQDRRSAATIMNYIKAFLEHPRLRQLVRNDQIESITLAGQIRIEVVTASYRAIRNRTVVAALLDEIAFWRNDEDSANPDREIITALEPAMATIPDALLLAASSPYAMRGVLWDMFDRHFGKPGGPLVWKAATRTMHPSLSQGFIDQQYEEDPIAAAAEYGAEFRSDVDAFVTREVLDAVIMHNTYEIPWNYKERYQAFVDPSGGSSDSMTLAIGHVDRKENRAVLDLLRERRAPFSPEAVVEDFVTILRQYKIGRVRGDYYGGEWPGDRFRKSGIAYDVSDNKKSDIYKEFLPLLNAQRVQLLDDRRMYLQLLNLERRTTRGGLETIDHPKGVHDDVANVAAGICVDLLGKHNPTIIAASVLARSAVIRGTHSIPLGTGPRW